MGEGCKLCTHLFFKDGSSEKICRISAHDLSTKDPKDFWRWGVFCPKWDNRLEKVIKCTGKK